MRPVHDEHPPGDDRERGSDDDAPVPREPTDGADDERLRGARGALERLADELRGTDGVLDDVMDGLEPGRGRDGRPDPADDGA